MGLRLKLGGGLIATALVMVAHTTSALSALDAYKLTAKNKAQVFETKGGALVMFHEGTDVIIISDKEQSRHGYANVLRDGIGTIIIEQDGHIIDRMGATEDIGLKQSPQTFPDVVWAPLDRIGSSTLSHNVDILPKGAQFQVGHKIVAADTATYDWTLASSGASLSIKSDASSGPHIIPLEAIWDALQ